MTSTIGVDLSIAGDRFSFDLCTKEVGLQPTRTWHRSIPSPMVPEAVWTVGIKPGPFESLGEAVQALLSMISGHERRIVEFSQTHQLDVTVSANVTIEDERPLYELDPNTMHALASLGATFMVDIFDYSNNQ